MLFVCECGREFNTTKGFKLHKARWCNLIKPKTFECQCGQIFKRLRGKDSLRLHRKTCKIFKDFRKRQRSIAASDGFRKSIERDPDKIKILRLNVGKKISKTILSNREERERRSKRLGDLNKTDQFRQKASETAIKTSARKDVQNNRSAQLDRWRKNNPDIFKQLIIDNHIKIAAWIKNNPEDHYNKCVKPLLSNFKSKPELSLLKFCKNILSDCQNSFIFHESFSTKSKLHQIDIFSKLASVIVEFDGPLHFNNIFGLEFLENKKNSDQEVNRMAEKYCIIRVSYDCYCAKTNSFRQDVLDGIKDLLLAPRLGLFLFGGKYGQDYQCRISG